MFSWEHCRKDIYEDVKSEMLMDENYLSNLFYFQITLQAIKKNLHAVEVRGSLKVLIK